MARIDEIDQEGHDAARHHALEQLGVGDGSKACGLTSNDTPMRLGSLAAMIRKPIAIGYKNMVQKRPALQGHLASHPR